MTLTRLMKAASGVTRRSCFSLTLLFLTFSTPSLYGAEISFLADTIIVRALNTDGSIMVGSIYPSVDAFRWTTATGFQDLGDLSGGQPWSSAHGVSADGSVIVGASHIDPDTYIAFRWTEATGMVSLGDLPGGIEYSSANSISADGSTIVGTGHSALGEEAFRWTEPLGMIGLGFLPGSSYDVTPAVDVSADGSVIVGSNKYSSGSDDAEAFRWTEATGMVSLGHLKPGDTWAYAHGVSDNGAVIVGESGGVGTDTEAFRWTEATGMVSIGDLPGGTYHSQASDVSADGSIIVGYGTSDLGREAFIWTETAGMQSLRERLTAEGVDLTGWTLEYADVISADGSTIVGKGYSLEGDMTYIARFDGLITPNNLSLSLSEMATLGPAAMYLGKANMEGLMDVSRESVIFGTGSEPRSANQFWTTGTLVGGDDLSGEFGAGAGVGLTHHYANGLSIGGGIFPGMRRFDTSHGGDQEIESIGPGIFLGYAPDAYGLRLEAGAMATLINLRLERGYQNGAGSAQSKGKTQGEGYGLFGRLGWVFPVTERMAVQPFIQHSWQHINYDGYTESEGPFPAKFDAFSDTVNISRAGIEGQYAFSESLGLRAWVAYSHRYENESPSMSGEVIDLNAFEFSGTDLDQDWMDTGMGVTWRPLDGFTTFSRLGLAVDADDTGTPDVTWTLGFQWDL